MPIFKNPYHHRLGQFNDFVLRDQEAEVFKGQWNPEVFKREGPLHLEIGPGSGTFMVDYCTQNPHINFIGMDYRFKRGFFLAQKLAALPQKNFRYLRAWGERMESIFNENEISTVYSFFPDPWPKTRHHKKRLFSPEFFQILYRLLQPGGIIYLKTDHDEYFKWICHRNFQEFSDLFEPLFSTTDLKEEFPGHFLSSFETQFEKIFIKQGIKIKALVLKSKKAPLHPGT